MRQLLLDSHALIWFFEDDERLPVPVKKLIEDAENEIYVSIASFWEIAIKKSLSKLDLKTSLSELFQECEKQQIEILPLSQQSIGLLETLPFHHRDPFDRIIITTSMAHGLEITSIDPWFDAYSIKRVW